MRCTLWTAYLLGASALMATIAICLGIPTLQHPLAAFFALDLHHHLAAAPAPGVGRAAVIVLANVRSTGWPLLLLAIGAHRVRALRLLGDVAVGASVAANVLPAGVAIAHYGLALCPYIPQLPLELWAICTGPGCWALGSLGRLSGRRLAGSIALILAALVCAAVLESWGVPHR